MSEELSVMMNAAIIGEGSPSSMSPQLHEEAVAEAAREKGWKPLDEFDGNAADWVDAKEFVGRQKLYDRISDLRRQNEKQATQFQRDMQDIQKHFSKMREVEYQRALKELQVQKVQAIEDGNVEAVERVTEQIQEVKQDIQEAKEAQKPQTAPTQQVTDEFVQWRKDNTWFDSDLELQREAISTGIGWASINQDKTQAEMLTHVSEKMKKLYPEKFQKERKPVDNKVESSGGHNSGAQQEQKKGKKLSTADLTEIEQKVMRTLIKRNALKHIADKEKISQEEVYLRQLADAKARS